MFLSGSGFSIKRMQLLLAFNCAVKHFRAIQSIAEQRAMWAAT